MRTIKVSSRPRQVLLFAAALCLVGTVGIFDHISGHKYSFGPFYLAVILFVGWYLNRASAFAITLVALLTGIVANYGCPPLFSSVHTWAIGVRLAFYIAPVLLLIRLREALEQARELSRVDFVTGLANRRSFSEQAEMEKNRARRYVHPLTIAYLDIDDFKQVNDQLGHAGGDEVLVAIARVLLSNLRDTDYVARIGGDEFAVLLPETDRSAAEFVIGKLHTELQRFGNGFRVPISCSIGAATFSGDPVSLEQMMEEADQAMYAAKRNGKSQVVHADIA